MALGIEAGGGIGGREVGMYGRGVWRPAKETS